MRDLPSRPKTITCEPAEGIKVVMRTASDEQADVVYDALMDATPVSANGAKPSEKTGDEAERVKLQVPARWLRLLFADNVVSVSGEGYDGFDPSDEEHIRSFPRQWRNECAMDVAVEAASDGGQAAVAIEKNSDAPAGR